MKKISFIVCIQYILCFNSFAQIKSDSIKTDSSLVIQQLIIKQKEDHKIDSIIRNNLQIELANAKLNSSKKNEIEQKLRELTTKDSLKKVSQLNIIENLKRSSKGYPVILFTDTIFNIFTKIGSFKPKARAEVISLAS